MTNRWQIVRLILEVVGDRTSKFGRCKVDGQVQNFGPAITNRKRSQTDRTWLCDQSCTVLSSIARDCVLTSLATGLATDWATMWLVVRFITISDEWLHNLKLVVQSVVICRWFHIKGVWLKLNICVVQECLKYLFKTTVSYQVWLNLCPISRYHTWEAVIWFYVTDIIICNDFTLDNIVLLNFISISFHL